MSDYTKATNFATKDSLPAGSALKIVRGTEIDTEFNAIATAVATKADNAAAAITGGTVNGAVIGGTTPAAGTFTTLTASSTTTLSGGTANGVAYLNGSKVVTTGSSLVFDGTNFGVGTSSPSTKLAVSGGVSGTAGLNISGAGWGILPYVSNSLVVDNNAGQARFFATGDASNFGSYIWYGGKTGGSTSTYMTLDASGRLGVNCTPSYQLDVYKSTAGAWAHFSGLNTTETSEMWLGTDSADSPNVVYLAGNNSTGNMRLDFRLGGTTSAYNVGSFDNSGNFYVGTTTPSAGYGITNTRATVYAPTGYVGLFAVTTDSTSATIYSQNSATTGDNLFQYFIVGPTSSGVTKGSIDYNRGGGLTRYNTTSDATLKNIIGDADGTKSVDILKSTRIREYSWKDDETNKPQIGVIAQELYETFKGAVSVGGDRTETDEEGNETTRYTPWAVDKTAFTFHLVAGWQAHEKIIKEQQTLIDQLTTRLEALEAK